MQLCIPANTCKCMYFILSFIYTTEHYSKNNITGKHLYNNHHHFSELSMATRSNLLVFCLYTWRIYTFGNITGWFVVNFRRKFTERSNTLYATMNTLYNNKHYADY